MADILADLCETLPDVDDPDYVKKINNKKEFLFSDYVPKTFGDPRSHQVNAFRQWGSQSPSQSAFLFWRTGAGKGRYIAKMMEYIADHPQRFQSTKNSHRFLVIVQASVIPQWKTELEKHEVFTSAKLRNKNTSYKVTGREVALTFSISKVVKLMRLDKFAAELRYKTPEEITKMYSTDILVLDEAHLVRTDQVLDDNEIEEFQVKERPVKGKRSTKGDDEMERKINYIQMRRLFRYAKCPMKIVMTATPMFDKPYELASVTSLLLPPERQINIEDFEEARKAGKEVLKAYLEPKLRGMVSFVGQKKHHVKVIDEGEQFYYTNEEEEEVLSNMKIYEVKMGPEQEKVYLKIRQNEDIGGGKKEAFYSKSRQALNSIYINPFDSEKNTRLGFEYNPKDSKGRLKPPEIRDLWHVVIDPPIKKLEGDNDQKRSNLEPHRFTYRYESELFAHCKPRNPNLKLYEEGGELDMERLEVIRRQSAKNAEIILLTHQNFLYQGEGEMVYYYNKLVKSGGGIPLGMDFDLMGYERFIGLTDDIDKMTKRPRYAYITGEPGSTAARNRNIRKIANHPKNLYGEYLRIVITSDVSSTGLSFLNVRKFIHGGTDFNLTRQPEGRTIRTDSHMFFPKERQKFVRRFFMAAALNDGRQTIDHSIWGTVEEKTRDIYPVEEVIEDISTDKFFNQNREADLYKYNPEKLPYDLSTYHLHWAQDEISVIESKIRHAFKMKNSWTLDEIAKMFEYDHDISTIIWTLTLMIERNDIVEDRFGLPWLLQHQNNQFALTPYIQNSVLIDGKTVSDIMSHQYTKIVHIAEPENFERIAKKEIKVNLDSTSQQDESSISDFVTKWNTFNSLQKLVYLEKALAKKIKNKDIALFILKKLDAVWFKDNDIIFHYYDDTKVNGNEGAFQNNRLKIDSKTEGTKMRILTSGSSEFRDATIQETERANKIVNDLWKTQEKQFFQEQKGEFFIIENVSSDGKIRIRRKGNNVKFKADGTIDMRTVPRGIIPTNFKPAQVLELLWSVKVPSGTEDTITPGRIDMLKVVKEKDKNANEYDNEKLKFYYSWVKYNTLKQMTDALIKYGKEKGFYARR